MAVLQFAKQCRMLASYPLLPLAVIIWVFVLGLPALSAKLIEDKDLVRSISFTWRHIYGKLSLAAGALCLVVFYFGACACDAAFFGVTFAAMILCVPIVIWNPEIYNLDTRRAAIVHVTFAALLFLYLLVVQIVMLANTPDPSPSQIIVFVFECIAAAGMFFNGFVEFFKHGVWEWTPSTSSFERSFIFLVALSFVLLAPEGTICP